MASISFSHVGKVYPDGTRAVTDLNLVIEEGEFTVLVGPSGCGKTTALRMVAGLEEISEGDISIGERVVNLVEPRKRDVAMVFQNYALYPHMSIFENIAFPLRSRRMPKQEIEQRVQKTAQLLGLQEMLKRRPRTLSGGQRQRVAMGRAIVREPQVFLMDEPLSNLDAKLRVQMRAEITKLQRDLGVTTLYVTHDQVEAMTMGSQIAVMRKGVLQQHGPAQELYDFPANLFVATFIGSPAMNLFRARLEQDGDGLACVLGKEGNKLQLPAAAVAKLKGLAAYRDRDVAVGIRPEHLLDGASANGSPSRLRGQVSLVETLGFERLVHIDIDAEPVLTADVLEIAQDIDAAALQALQEEAIEHKVPLVGRFDTQTTAEPGQPIDLVVRPEAVRFFDLDSGVAIT
jgi:multiple sugar transport system ATP-binding protein